VTDPCCTFKSGKDECGFTLVEILVAIFIFGVVLSTIYSSYVGTSRIVSETEYQAEIYSMARITLDRMHEDLESVHVPQNPVPSESEEEDVMSADFVGKDADIDGRDADSLRFLSTAHIVFSEEDRPSGTAEIEYYVKQSEEEGHFILYRSDTPELEERPDEGTGGLVLCEKLLSIDFTYYDAEGEEYDNWDSTAEAFEGKIPSLVSISLELENRRDEEAPYKFLTTVYIPMGGDTGDDKDEGSEDAERAKRI
jgi:general secretion pathway protein J